MTGPRATVFDESDPLAFSSADLPDRPAHDRILLVRPTHFDVRYAINPYTGGDVDRERALAQWERLRETYERYADSVAVLDPDETWTTLQARDVDLPAGVPNPAPPAEVPDLVFAANLGLSTADGRGVVPASMATDVRRGEPAHFVAWARGEGYRVLDPPPAAFEGTGDAVWHPGKRLLWGGYGVRTERAAYDDLADRLETPVLALELTDDRYYHLDVCLTPLDGDTALIQPEAFTEGGLDRIAEVFERVLEVPVEESREGLAGNAHCPDGEHVLLPAGNPETESILADAGFEPLAVETGEFGKAGGSVFCLKLTLGEPA
ncbi:arginine deiminase-related protein [Halovivax sp.]|uniref:dimethylarginine dimethylaminohydrolase family protein n=1 Tax=Halovivax sp. TaxID=1935978 RepID=UPI0025C33D4A|nr:arginine deiminase-related protein [Halovivax sp.]